MSNVKLAASWFLAGLSLGITFGIINEPLMSVVITLFVLGVVIHYDE